MRNREMMVNCTDTNVRLIQRLYEWVVNMVELLVHTGLVINVQGAFRTTIVLY